MKDGETGELESSNKYIWLLLILPLGLMVGTVTSTCSHLKDDMAENDFSRYRVSQNWDKKSLRDDMEKVLLVGKDDGEILLKNTSSSLGLHSYLKIRATQNYGPKLGIYDIKGDDEDKITAVVVELDHSPSLAKAALLGAVIAEIKSLAGETNFSHTLRFVFLTKSTSLEQMEGEIVTGNERLDSYLLLRTSPLIKHSNATWMPISNTAEKSNKGEILTHTTLMHQAGTQVSDEHVGLTLEAAKQLQHLLKAKMVE